MSLESLPEAPERPKTDQSATTNGNGNGSIALGVHPSTGDRPSVSGTLDPSLGNAPIGTSPPLSSNPWPGLGLIFASTILVSAFLLFQVQPLISKFILPWFGGSPAVWTTCMLFFQVTLFAGYAYAHLLSRYLSTKAQAVVHFTLMTVALAVIFPSVAPDVTWKPADSSNPTTRILLLLAATVGLPYFVLSTTGPLVQAWFARTWPGRSPYRLYALSNVGSLAALLTFPFVFERAFASNTQAVLWTGAFALFALLCGTSAAWIFRLPKNPAAEQDYPETSAAGVLVDSPDRSRLIRPSTARRLQWIALPACASLMLLATTNYVCQDVAVIPFLWVVPLALYLLTFIVCFDHPRWYLPLTMSIVAMGFLMFSAGAYDTVLKLAGKHTYYLWELELYFGTMFFVCMLCHGQLFRLRPSTEYLTEYYLLISAGGAMGGIFVGLIAPYIFKTHFEWPLGLAASLVVAAVVAITEIVRRTPADANPGRRFASFGVVGVLIAATIGWLIYGLGDDSEVIYRGRNFYGTVSVYEVERDSPEFHRRTFFSGTTAHGKQFVEPAKRRIPISYFGENTGVGQTLKSIQDRPDARVGVIGMGVAVAAAYARPGQYYRFYEINDQVDDIARHHFTYLDDCQCPYDVIMADARLALEHELADGHPQNFDVLALDAFMGDAPPIHLLTDEAFDVYLKHLKPDGVIVVNITNRYINLVPVINAVAKKHGLSVTRVMTDDDGQKLLNHTDFMMLTRNEKFLEAHPPELLAKNLQPEYEVPLWTDRYSNLFSILKQ